MKWLWCLFSLCFVVLLLFYYLNYQHYRAGLRFFKKGLHSKAKEEFSYILSRRPFIFSARLNLALLEFLQKNYENALGEYAFVFENSKKQKDRFHSYFNSGYLESSRNEINEALSYYQKALGENTESIEVKTNIELMMKNLQDQNASSSSSKDHQSQDSSHPDHQSKENSWKQTKGLDPNQVQSILREIEKREQELKSKLNESESAEKGVKKW